MSTLCQILGGALPGLAKLVLSQPADPMYDKKLTVRPVLLKGETRYQAESIRDNKAFHRNLDADGLLTLAEELEGRYRQLLVVTAEGGSQYVLRQRGGYKKSGAAPGLPLPGGGRSHDREKEYILAQGEDIPALVDLGVFTADMKVVRSKYDKYKQLNRFVELVDQEFSDYDRPEISILDFGCGKSYLTFLLYYYFTVKKGLKARITGYDLKADVVEDCNKIAEKYGYVGLRFLVADVTRDVLAEEHIDMVVTLHACDVATDYALSYAVSKGVEHIFSVPCCQHEVNSSIKKGGELDIFMGHGIIQERMCALLTDSIRAAVLEDRGYEVDVIEFIDFVHSPKNLMLRARYTGKRRSASRAAAQQLRERYGFTQTLLELVD